MHRLATIFLILAAFILSAGSAQAQSNYRRGNPAFGGAANIQYYLVDSDDNLYLTPQYGWKDTLYNPTQWKRVNFDATENVYAGFPTASNVDWYTYDTIRVFPGQAFVSTSGTISLTPSVTNDAFAKQTNTIMPTSTMFSCIAPLWGPLEMHTTGDSSKVFVRQRSDSIIVSFYNMFLKGTAGKVSATFQVVFNKLDSSVTFHYKTFAGSYAGIPAWKLFQDRVTIGIQGTKGNWSTLYLDRGVFYAKGTSNTYNKDLHDGLAVKFYRIPKNFIRVASITNPPSDRYELSSNQFAPTFTLQNISDSITWLYYRYALVNTGTGQTVYNRTDSIFAYFKSSVNKTADNYSGLNAGQYRLTVTVDTTSRTIVDPWYWDNIMTRTFTLLGTLSFPYYEDWDNGFNYAKWANSGAEVLPAADVMYDPVSPRRGISGALVLDRRDINGVNYNLGTVVGDTVTSGAMNLSGKSGVWMTFSYQRGLMTDTVIGGEFSRWLSGPESGIKGVTNPRTGDTLYIEGLASTGNKDNPTEASWTRIGAIGGGLDVRTQKFQVQLPSGFMHDHFRLRFRLAAQVNQPAYVSLPFDDQDAFVIDGLQITDIATGKTDLEILGIDLTGKNLTHIPRDVAFGVIPKLRIYNNGDAQTQALYLTHVIIKDALGRAVYDKVTSFSMPLPHQDTIISLQPWDIRGSQGGRMTIMALVDQVYTDYNKNNDTNSFVRYLYIDDAYAWDDGTPDTMGTTRKASTDFSIDFTPMISDSIRGADVYFMGLSGQTSWLLTIKDGSTVVGTRQFTLTPAAEGWLRATFAPLKLTGGTMYNLRFTMTGGTAEVGGDASHSMNWQTSNDGSGTYAFLYPGVVSMYRNSSGARFDSTITGTNYGSDPLLPMVRLVYKGSSTFLPVELSSLGAYRKYDGSVSINWRTALEQNVSQYLVEREEAGSWVTIGTSQPRSATGAVYAMADANAPRTEVLYRLTETDLDGTTHALGTVMASAMSDNRSTSLTVYPNPARGRARLAIEGVTPEKLRILDPLGREVLSLTSEGSSQELPVAELSNGFYYIEATTAGVVARTPFVVAR